mmetsp:Transcript_51313/g.171246  ORF Transcript_51313/g.171246 Transcript_51313/m.171246 type:complete len:219 (-) Transcript_51313:410-1066(-)
MSLSLRWRSCSCPTQRLRLTTLPIAKLIHPWPSKSVVLLHPVRPFDRLPLTTTRCAMHPSRRRRPFLRQSRQRRPFLSQSRRRRSRRRTLLRPSRTLPMARRAGGCCAMRSAAGAPPHRVATFSRATRLASSRASARPPAPRLASPSSTRWWPLRCSVCSAPRRSAALGSQPVGSPSTRVASPFPRAWRPPSPAKMRREHHAPLPTCGALSEPMVRRR